MTARPSPAPDLTDDELEWDDQLWDDVWERMLDRVERHHLARVAFGRTEPTDAFELRVGRELARRWARRCAVNAAAWLAFVAFWAMIGFQARANGLSVVVPAATVAVGSSVVVGCLIVRWHLRRRAAP